jgi:hypothetical protein
LACIDAEQAEALYQTANHTGCDATEALGFGPALSKMGPPGVKNRRPAPTTSNCPVHEQCSARTRSARAPAYSRHPKIFFGGFQGCALACLAQTDGVAAMPRFAKIRVATLFGP